MISVNLYTDQNSHQHSHRGIGAYTRQLSKALSELGLVKLVKSPAEAQIVHYPSFDFFRATLPLISKKPIVVTIHDAVPLMYPKQYPSGLKGAVNLWRQKMALSNVAAVITDSQASKKEVTRLLGVQNHKVHVIPLAADADLHYQEQKLQQKVAQKYHLPKEFILYVGDINYSKSIPTLIAAFSQVQLEYPNLNLVLLGKNFRPQPIPEWRAIESALANCPAKNQVHFLTKVEQSAGLAAVYSQATAYIQPSIAEGFGLPILEAMQCYCPVVCFNQSSMAEVAGESAVYASTFSEGALARAVTTVLGWSGKERHHRVATAYSWSRTFTWQKTASLTAAVYQSVAL